MFGWQHACNRFLETVNTPLSDKGQPDICKLFIYQYQTAKQA